MLAGNPQPSLASLRVGFIDFLPDGEAVVGLDRCHSIFINVTF